MAQTFSQAATVAALAIGAASFGLPAPAGATLHNQNYATSGIHIVRQRRALARAAAWIAGR
jgi:hypothetical protein